MPYRDIGKLVTIKGLEEELDWIKNEYGLYESELVKWKDGNADWCIPWGRGNDKAEVVAVAIVKEE